MTAPPSAFVSESINPNVELVIRTLLFAAIAAACYVIVRPFLALIAWGVIVAIAVLPGYRLLLKLFSGKNWLAAVVATAILLIATIIPGLMLAEMLIEGIHLFMSRLQDGTLVPPPPGFVENIPVVGHSLKDSWDLASKDTRETLARYAPQVRQFTLTLLATLPSLGFTVLQFAGAIILSGFLLANRESNGRLARLMFVRVFGNKGPELQELSEATVRSVAVGVLGVAIIQTFLAVIGILAIGLPAAGLWAIVFFAAAVLQVGTLVLIPLVFYVFTIASTTHAMMFFVWCVVVGVSDNVLKALLLGRGSKVPLAVIFLGVLGGFLSSGLIGMFVGAIILSVGFKLLSAWLQAVDPSVA